MNYKFDSYITEDKQKIFLKNNHERITKLLNTCFDTDFEGYDDILFLTKYFLFVCMYDDKLIGIISCGKDHGYMFKTENGSDIKTYDSLAYIYDSHERIFLDGNNNEIKKTKYVEFEPVIQNICKDMNYSKVGEFLLINVENFCRKMGYYEIYTIPESSKFKKQLINAHEKYNTKDENTKQILLDVHKKYQETQQKLIKYYSDHGYVIDKGFYVSDIIPHGNALRKEDNINHVPIIYLNIMVKKL